MKYNPNKIYIVCDGSSYYGVYGWDIEDEIKENDVELYSNKGYDDWSDEVEDKITKLNDELMGTRMYR
jgi:hypothetical protein